jgi:RNA polymerase sigma-70 factor (ECF subfamily)
VWTGLPISEAGSTIVGLSRLPRHEFDRAYLERLTAGDPETERHFTRYFGDLLSLKLRARLRSREQIEDAKQETFARVLTSLKRKSGVKTPEALGAFVNSVCNNVVFEIYRSGTRTVPLEEDFDAADERQPGPDSAITASEDRERVRAALLALPQKERDLLTWLFFEGREKDQVCRELGVDRDYLRVLLHRAKNRFREQLAQEDTE